MRNNFQGLREPCRSSRRKIDRRSSRRSERYCGSYETAKGDRSGGRQQQVKRTIQCAREVYRPHAAVGETYVGLQSDTVVEVQSTCSPGNIALQKRRAIGVGGQRSQRQHTANRSLERRRAATGGIQDQIHISHAGVQRGIKRQRSPGQRLINSQLHGA